MATLTMNPWGIHVVMDPPLNSSIACLLKMVVASSTSNAPKFFKDVLSGKVSSTKLILDLVQMMYKSMIVIMCSDLDIEWLVEPFAYTLVGKISFHPPHMDDILALFHNIKLSSVFAVGLLDAHHVLIKLFNNLDYSRVSLRRSYYVLNY